MGEMATNTPSSPFNPYNQLDFLTPAQEDHINLLYYYNIENGILPNLRITRCEDPVFWTEIRKVRIYARNFLDTVYRYLSNDRVLYHINNKEDAQTEFSVLEDNLFQVTKLIQFVWITIFQSTPLESVVAPRDLILQQRRVLSRVLFADPLASSYFWQAGLLMCTMGELLRNDDIALDDVPDQQVATRILNRYSGGLLKLGSAILTRNADNTCTNVQENGDLIRNRIRDILLTYITPGEIPETELLNEYREAVDNDLDHDVENFVNTLSGVYFYQPPLPTRFPVVRFQASCFKRMLKRMCNTLSVGFNWLFQGMTVTVFGLFLYNLKLCNMVVGENFCREFHEYSLLNSAGAVNDPLYKHFHPTDPNSDWMEDSEGFFDDLNTLRRQTEEFMIQTLAGIRPDVYVFEQQHSVTTLRGVANRYLNVLLLAFSNLEGFAALHRGEFLPPTSDAYDYFKDEVTCRALLAGVHLIEVPAPHVLQIPKKQLGKYNSRFSSGSEPMDKLLRYPMKGSQSSTIFDEPPPNENPNVTQVI